MSNSTDLSYIKTLEDLRAMQVMVKLRIKEREKDLGERVNKVPQELLKAGVGKMAPFLVKFIPGLLSRKVTGSAFSIIRSLLGMLFTKKSTTKEKSGLFSSAKKLGMFSLLRVGYNLWKKK